MYYIHGNKRGWRGVCYCFITVFTTWMSTCAVAPLWQKSDEFRAGSNLVWMYPRTRRNDTRSIICSVWLTADCINHAHMLPSTSQGFNYKQLTLNWPLFRFKFSHSPLHTIFLCLHGIQNPSIIMTSLRSQDWNILFFCIHTLLIYILMGIYYGRPILNPGNVMLEYLCVRFKSKGNFPF